jgi:BCD family chlorophyll transporter-like MFS transporter
VSAVLGSRAGIGWLGVARLGLVQTSLGAIVVLMTSTLNRVMVVELALAAVLPAALVGWHYAVQLSRPRWGYGSDVGGSRIPWILGGMIVLALGAIAAAGALFLTPLHPVLAIVASFGAYLAIGVGVGAAGTNLLALLAMRTAPDRKAAAAAIVWIMMIAGFVLTATVAGRLLDPFSMRRLLDVTVGVCVVALGVASLAVWGMERAPAQPESTVAQHRPSFREALAHVWEEAQSRRFTIFVFVSMLAYSTQDLILEPFAGLVYGYTPGQSTRLSGLQNAGVLAGMATTALVGTTIGRSRARFMRRWTVAGCVLSAAALASLSYGALRAPEWPLETSVVALGVANGAFAVAAIGSMMTLASAGEPGREGTRMGVWGAAQAIAFGTGGLVGAGAVDLARAWFGEAASAFSWVFACEAALFLVAAELAARVGATRFDGMRLPPLPAGEPAVED